MMAGEKNLSVLLKNMSAELKPSIYVFVTSKQDKLDHDVLDHAVCSFQEDEGLTLILPREKAVAHGIDFSYPCRMITLHIHSSLEAVGFLAKITAALAEQSISVNAISAYYHDHLFVPEDVADKAMKILKALSDQSV